MKFSKDTWALVIGIEDYDFPSPLPGAVNSAIQFAKLLILQGVEPSQIYLRLAPNPQKLPDELRDAKPGSATFADMRNLLEGELCRNAGKLLCIFWAGHGAKDGRARRLFLADSGSYGTFDFEGLLSLLADARYKFSEQLIFVDTCANDLGRDGMHTHVYNFNVTPATKKGQFAFFAASLGQSAEFTDGIGVYSNELTRLLEADTPPANPEDLANQLYKRFEERPPGSQKPFYEFHNSDKGVVSGGGDAIKADFLKQHKNPPSLPVGYVERSGELDALRTLLLRDPGDSMAITAVRGMPGAGKSILVTSLLKHQKVKERYPDIVWVSVGQVADPLTMMYQVMAALGEPWGNHIAEPHGSSQVKRLLCRRKALIVLDDVWDPLHVMNFRLDESTESALLITTRKEAVVSQTGAVEFPLGKLTEPLALQLLANRCQKPVEELPAVAPNIVKQCGNLALAVAIVGARLRAKPESIWAVVLQQLESADLEGLGSMAGYEHKDVFRAIHVSVQDLPEAARVRYRDICVFPEDSIVPTATLEKLWDATSGEVLTIVEAWVNNALAEFDDAGRIRFHDLFLDYARHLCGNPDPIDERLVVSDRKKRQKEKLVALHRRLLDVHRPPSGRWAELPESEPYLWDFLSWHLIEAGLTEELHALLAAETAGERNGWYEAVVRADRLPGYFTDLSRAWHLASEQSLNDINKGHPASAIGLEIRYALSLASINTLTTGLPLPVLLAAVTRRLLTPSQLLSHLQSMPQANAPQRYHKIEAFMALSAICVEPQQSELLRLGLEVARETKEEEEQAKYLVWLASKIPEPLLREALEMTHRFQDNKLKEQALSFIVGRVAELGQTAEAISLTQTISNDEHRARAICAMSRFLPREALRQALELTQVMEQKSSARYDALTSVVSRLAQLGDAQAALDLVATISNARSQARALIDSAPFLDEEALDHALELAGRISDFEERVKASAKLAQQLSEPRRTEILEQLFDEARRNWSKEGEYARKALIPLLSQSLLLKHLKFTFRDEERVQAITRLAELGCVSEALTQISRLEPYRQQARECLDAIAPYLAVTDLPEVQRMVAALDDRNDREIVLSTLLPRVAEFGNGQEALKEADGFANEFWRGEAIKRIVPHLNAAGLRSVVERFQKIADVTAQREALLLLAAESPQSLFSEITDALSEGVSGAVQERALNRIGMHLRPTHPQLLSIFPVFIEDRQNRAQAQLTLAPFLDPAEREEAIREALNTDCEIFGLTKTLARLLPELDEPFRSEVRRLALDSARGLLSPGTSYYHAPLLADLADLGEPQQALAAVRSVGEIRIRVKALALLCSHLPEAQQPEVIAEVLTAVRQETSPHSVVIDLCEEDVELPQPLLQEALKTVREKCEVWQIVPEVMRLVIRLAETGSPEEALNLARLIPPDRAKLHALALAGVAAHWPEAGRSEMLAEAADAACRVNDQPERTGVLRLLAAQLELIPRDRLCELWSRMLRSLAAHTRPELLADLGTLAAVIARLGGIEAVERSRQTIREIVRVWP